MRLLFAFLALTAIAFAADEPLLLQKPTLSKTQIVFAYAGDLWSVAREGGAAARLTSGTGTETDPAFSPDGTRIAFTGEYDGNVDVFVIPAAGGVPKRLTWHPAADRVLGWTPDGKRILFGSARTAYSRYGEIFSVPVEGGVEEKLPLPSGYEASMSADGQSIAYEPTGKAFQMWKRYRGGRTTRIWLAKLSDSSVTKVPRTNSNDFNPMWAGDRVYFLSDRNGPATLFYYDVKSKAVHEAIANQGLDVKSASLGPDAIVYEQFGGISLYDLKTGKSKPVAIRVQGDFPELRSKLVNVGRRLSAAAISPNGARAVFTARGEIISVPAEKGDPRNLTNTPGVMEREPQWSPDGKSIAYLSDESGEYALHVRAQSGAGEVKKIVLKAGFYRSPKYSPDSKKIALVDSFARLFYVDLETGKQVEVGQDTYQMRTGDISGEWSPDSKWLAYSKVLPNELSAIHLFSLTDGKSTQVTDGLSDATNPVFDKDGKYLYFTASTNSGESLGLDIHAVARTSTSSVYLAVLDKTQPSPFAPESDEEKAADDKKPSDAPKPDAAGSGPPASGARPAEPPKPKADVKVDLDGIDQRILSMPMPPRRYTALQVGKAGTLLALEGPGSGCNGPRHGGTPLRPEGAEGRRAAHGRQQFPDVGRRREGTLSAGRELDDRGLAAHATKLGWCGASSGSATGGRTGRAEDERDRSAGGSGRGMEADVPRGVAGGARLVLRPKSSRPGCEGSGEEVRALFAQRLFAGGSHVSVPGDAGQYDGQSYGNGRRRYSGSEARANGAAGRGLRG